MTRTNIFEILASEYDIQKEFKRIVQLFDSPTISNMSVTNNPSVKIEDLFDHLIVHWKQRGAYLSCKEMRKDIWQHVSNKRKPTTDDILMMLEYFSNITFILYIKCLQNNGWNMLISDRFKILEKNIKILLEHLNHELVCFEEEEKFLIIPKNPAATAVAEISSKETANAILKYHHASLKGQLEEKRKLLLTIATEYEPLLDDGIPDFNSYFTTVRGMINNAHIRHNNKEGTDKKEIIAKMSDEELEKLYDEIYQLLLFCVLAKDNKERKNKMAEFLKGLKEKK